MKGVGHVGGTGLRPRRDVCIGVAHTSASWVLSILAAFQTERSPSGIRTMVIVRFNAKVLYGNAGILKRTSTAHTPSFTIVIGPFP